MSSFRFSVCIIVAHCKTHLVYMLGYIQNCSDTILILLPAKQPKIHRVLAVLSALGLDRLNICAIAFYKRGCYSGSESNKSSILQKALP